MIYAALLLLTAAIEVPAVATLSPREERARMALVALFVNLATHPVAFLARVEAGVPFALVELGVVVAEALAFRATGCTWRRGAALALLANGATIGISFGL